MQYFKISKEQLGNGSNLPILKLGDSGEVFYELALEMLAEIKKNNAEERRTIFICPVGPVGQYPIFVRLVNRERVSLKNCWFINMDEYLGDDGAWIDIGHQLSFRGFMQRNVYDQIDETLRIPPEQRIFPDPKDVDAVGQLIESLGGVDIAFGGIGINGHLAFNEPQNELSPKEFAALTTRILEISRETRTINAVGDLNGAIEAMPRRCVTIGMKEILCAKKLRLACFRDWHRAVVRQAAYGEVSAAFPATLAQLHPDALLIINENCAIQPIL